MLSLKVTEISAQRRSIKNRIVEHSKSPKNRLQTQKQRRVEKEREKLNLKINIGAITAIRQDILLNGVGGNQQLQKIRKEKAKERVKAKEKLKEKDAATEIFLQPTTKKVLIG